MLLIGIAVFSLLFIDQNAAGNNQLTLKLIPSLAGTRHVYRVIASCYGSNGELLYGGNPGEGYATDHSNNDDVITLLFTMGNCATYSVYVTMIMTLDDSLSHLYPLRSAWPNSYSKNNIINNGMSHRILFGDHFHLSISPALESRDLFYHIRVYCDETESPKQNVEIDVESGKANETWTVSDDYSDYKFKTYSNESTMVVFNSEERQCANNTYHIKVWTIQREWLQSNLILTERPIVHYVCKSHGNGETRQIAFLNHFQLQIEPPLDKKDKNVYYVEARCHDFKVQTFKTITKSNTDVVLHKFNCKAYDIAARKVPLDWIQQSMNSYNGYQYKEKIETTRRSFVSNVSITNGDTYVFHLNMQPSKRRKTIELTFENESKSALKSYSEKKITTIIEVSDDEQQEEEEEDNENENEKQPKTEKTKKSEMKDDCYFYYPL
uniref:Calsyntenin-1 n=1 Tax=Globodera pallida TaxID=36090 RepID=A0A183BYB8_GLOPA